MYKVIGFFWKAILRNWQLQQVPSTFMIYGKGKGNHDTRTQRKTLWFSTPCMLANPEGSNPKTRERGEKNSRSFSLLCSFSAPRGYKRMKCNIKEQQNSLPIMHTPRVSKSQLVFEMCFMAPDSHWVQVKTIYMFPYVSVICWIFNRNGGSCCYNNKPKVSSNHS